MHIEKINLLNFKNYEEADLVFSSQINVFTGDNGAGKTNLLDAIYCLSLTKSAFNSSESNNITHGKDYFSVLGHFFKNNKIVPIQYDFSGGQKKSFKADKTAYEKLSDHIGLFPVVLITPNDTDVIREGSEERRKFFDMIISQLDKIYLSELMKYNNILKQRNSLLKQFAEKRYVDKDLIDSYNHQILASGKYIYKVRKEFIKEFIPVFINHYQNLSENKEIPLLEYESQLHKDDFEKSFLASQEKDILLQRTGMGVHKDDYTFLIDEYPVKNFGSQGQQKSFVIALKLTHFDAIKKQKELKPILLLDDIFDKLDEHRINKLVQMVNEENFGQIFITDARPERTEKIFDKIKGEISIFRIEKGIIVNN